MRLRSRELTRKKIIGIDASRAAKEYKTGTEWYAYHVIQELKKIVPAEYEVRLYSPAVLSGDLGQMPAHWQNVVLRWPGYLWTTVRLAWEMLVRPPDVLWLPCSGLPLVLPKKTVNTIHDVGFDRFPQAYKLHTVWFHRFYVREALRRCAAVLTVSNFSKREILDLYKANPDKIFVTPLAADKKFHEFTSTKISELRQKYKLDNYILYVGRVETKKNIAGLVNSFEKVLETYPSMQLAVAGPAGDAEYLIEQIVKKYPQNVRRLSWVSADDLPILFAGAKVFWFVTLYEGFGIPILEAFAANTPVITSAGGAHEEVAGEAACSVEPNDSALIAEGLIKILNDKQYRDRLVEAGKKRVSEFSWQRTSVDTWNILRDL